MGFWRDFGPLGTTITPLQRGGFPTFATTLYIVLLISFIQKKNKPIKESTTSEKFEL